MYAQWNSSVSTAAITLPTATRTGYTFKGWATSSTATSGSTGSYTPTTSVTLYATWSANSITFKYYSNNGTQTNFVNWTATADRSFPTNHWQYTTGTYKQTYEGHTGTGYYGTTTTGTGGYLVGEAQKFTSYSDLCEKHGVSVDAVSTIVNLYCQWKADGLVYIYELSSFEPHTIQIYDNTIWE